MCFVKQATERVDLRPPDLVDGRRFAGAIGDGQNGLGEIADVDRLEPGFAADQRHQRRHSRDVGKAVEELVFGAEDDGRPEDDCVGEFGQHRGFAGSLGAPVDARRAWIGAEGGDVDESLDAGRARGTGNGTGALDVYFFERLRAAFEKQTDEVDGHVGAIERGRDGRRKPEIGLHRVDLADGAHRLEIASEIRPADRGAHTPAVARHGPHGVAPDKPRAAENSGKTARLKPCGCHVLIPIVGNRHPARGSPS